MVGVGDVFRTERGAWRLARGENALRPGGRMRRSLTSTANSGESETIMYSNRVF